jgi:hypothetical protein
MRNRRRHGGEAPRARCARRLDHLQTDLIDQVVRVVDAVINEHGLAWP